jgi:hypothetical protein
MNGTQTKLARRDIIRAVGPEVVGTLNKQGTAIAQLSEDIREAFQQQNDKIRELIGQVDRAELRLHRLEHPDDVA